MQSASGQSHSATGTQVHQVTRLALNTVSIGQIPSGPSFVLAPFATSEAFITDGVQLFEVGAADIDMALAPAASPVEDVSATAIDGHGIDHSRRACRAISPARQCRPIAVSTIPGVWLAEGGTALARPDPVRDRFLRKPELLLCDPD